jgi:thiamine biosynthesis lipoprotein
MSSLKQGKSLMVTRCKPLLGTFVEISIDEDHHHPAIEYAFAAIEKIQILMGFHDPNSELNRINRLSHQRAIEIHPWTAQVLRVAKQIHRQSQGLFNCGIGHRLVAAGLLPQHINYHTHDLGGIEDVCFLSSELISSTRPICLDLGGIAKGFAVDMAVRILRSEGVLSGSVNAGGDLKVFGDNPRPIHLRNPHKPSELYKIGNLQNAALATSSLYFAHRAHQNSHLINPLATDNANGFIQNHDSYSIIAKDCIYADALTKVLAISQQIDHPCFTKFSAQAFRIPA